MARQRFACGSTEGAGEGEAGEGAGGEESRGSGASGTELVSGEQWCQIGYGNVVCWGRELE